MRKIIIETYGTEEVHATHYSGNYATLCGLDGDDDHPDVRQKFIDYAPNTAKIDCKECRDIIIHARCYELDDLAPARTPGLGAFKDPAELTGLTFKDKGKRR